MLRYILTYDLADKARDLVTRALIKLITVTNKSKARGLSKRLHKLADHYDTRPTGEWEN